MAFSRAQDQGSVIRLKHRLPLCIYTEIEDFAKPVVQENPGCLEFPRITV